MVTTMKRIFSTEFVMTICLAVSITCEVCLAQETQTISGREPSISSNMLLSVPRLVRVEGIALDRAGKKKAGPVELEFAMMPSKESAAPLWREHQTAQADASGKFSILLGVTSDEGLPISLFTESGERWLAVSVDGVAQPRKLLDSTPYAIRSFDSERLSGHPASDFMLAKDCCAASAQLTGNADSTEHPVAGWSKNPESSSFGLMGSVTGRNSTAGVFRTTGGGDLLVGTNEKGNIFRVDATGRGYFNNAVQIGGADFAEMVPVSRTTSEYEAGDVLVIDPKSERHLTVSRKPYSRLIAGVYATKPGIVARDSGTPVIGDEVPLAMIGIVPCKASAENGTIRVGDELVTAATTGHVMRAGKNAPRGTVLGKALQPLASGKNKISILLYLH